MNKEIEEQIDYQKILEELNMIRGFEDQEAVLLEFEHKVKSSLLKEVHGAIGENRKIRPNTFGNPTDYDWDNGYNQAKNETRTKIEKL